eukprot:1343168-Karenia_brevis.AAC.1
MSYPGTFFEQSQLGNVEPTPIPGAPDRSQQKHAVLPLGPVGLLLQQTHHFGAALNIERHTFH